jgi:hypothetical protein
MDEVFPPQTQVVAIIGGGSDYASRHIRRSHCTQMAAVTSLPANNIF